MADSRHRHGAKKRPSSSRYGDGSASQPKIVKNGHGGGYSDFDVSSLPPAPGNVPYPRFSDTNELVVADRSGFAGEIYEQFKHAYKVDNTVEPVKCSMLLDTYVYYRDQNNAVVWKQASSPLLMMTSQKLNTLIKSHRFHYPDQRIILGMPLELSGATLENILAYCHGVPLTIEKTKTVAEKTKFLEFLFIAASYLQIYKLVMDIKQAAIREGIRLEFSEMETFVKELRDPDMLKVFPKDLNDLPSHTREERARSRSGGAPNQMTTAPTMNSYGYANSQPAGYGALPPKPVQPALVPTGLSMPPVPIAPPVAFSDFALKAPKTVIDLTKEKDSKTRSTKSRWTILKDTQVQQKVVRQIEQERRPSSSPRGIVRAPVVEKPTVVQSAAVKINLVCRASGKPVCFEFNKGRCKDGCKERHECVRCGQNHSFAVCVRGAPGRCFNYNRQKKCHDQCTFAHKCCDCGGSHVKAECPNILSSLAEYSSDTQKPGYAPQGPPMAPPRAELQVPARPRAPVITTPVVTAQVMPPVGKGVKPVDLNNNPLALLDEHCIAYNCDPKGCPQGDRCLLRHACSNCDGILHKKATCFSVKGFCLYYNRHGKCTQGNNCKFEHKCCDCKAVHPKIRCPERPPIDFHGADTLICNLYNNSVCKLKGCKFPHRCGICKGKHTKRDCPREGGAGLNVSVVSEISRELSVSLNDSFSDGLRVQTDSDQAVCFDFNIGNRCPRGQKCPDRHACSSCGLGHPRASCITAKGYCVHYNKLKHFKTCDNSCKMIHLCCECDTDHPRYKCPIRN